MSCSKQFRMWGGVMFGAWFWFLLTITEKSAEMEEPLKIAQGTRFCLRSVGFHSFPSLKIPKRFPWSRKVPGVSSRLCPHSEAAPKSAGVQGLETPCLGEDQRPGQATHLVVLIYGAEDHLGSVLGNLELCLCDRGAVVHDDHDVLGLRANGGDVDGPEEGQNPNHHHQHPVTFTEMLMSGNMQGLKHPSKEPGRNSEEKLYRNLYMRSNCNRNFFFPWWKLVPGKASWESEHAKRPLTFWNFKLKLGSSLSVTARAFRNKPCCLHSSVWDQCSNSHRGLNEARKASW